MQFLNDDSSEWMRKAAEDYPVKPFGMNWEAVAEQLPDEAPPKEAVGYVLLRYAAMVVFFLLLSLVCNKYLSMDFNNRYAATVSKSEQQSSGATISTTPKPIVQSGNKTAPIPANDPLGTNRSAKPIQLKEDQLLVDIMEEQMVSTERPSTAIVSSIPGMDRNVENEGGLSEKEPPARLLTSKGIEKDDRVINAAPTSEAQKDLISQRRFYAGLMVGPDFSSIKFQKTEGIGFNLGLFLGYRFSSKWQLESGVLLNRKEYYSGGKYFNASSMYLPSHAYITSVDGYCTMFEIPLNVRYNFHQQKQTRWFAVAGLSSYLMNKEDYNYTYKRYNEVYNGNKVYNGLSKNWLTVINTGIGYEKTINEKFKIRLEPYLKVPLRGMGTGKLPISSAGMNVGISYPIK